MVWIALVCIASLLVATSLSVAWTSSLVARTFSRVASTLCRVAWTLCRRTRNHHADYRQGESPIRLNCGDVVVVIRPNPEVIRLGGTRSSPARRIKRWTATGTTPPVDHAPSIELTSNRHATEGLCQLWPIAAAATSAGKQKVDGLPESFSFHVLRHHLSVVVDCVGRRYQDGPGADAARERAHDLRYLRPLVVGMPMSPPARRSVPGSQSGWTRSELLRTDDGRHEQIRLFNAGQTS